MHRYLSFNLVDCVPDDKFISKYKFDLSWYGVKILSIQKYQYHLVCWRTQLIQKHNWVTISYKVDLSKQNRITCNINPYVAGKGQGLDGFQ